MTFVTVVCSFQLVLVGDSLLWLTRDPKVKVAARASRAAPRL